MLTSGKHIDILKRVVSTDIKEIFKRSIQKLRMFGSQYRSTPDFIITGTRKGGTTSLYNYLCQHPQIMHAYEKEVEYFDSNHLKTLLWYKSFFPFSFQKKQYSRFYKKQFLCGEATPNYIYTQRAIKGLLKLNPEIKLIFLLRDPIERAISDYKYAIRRNALEVNNINFESLIKKELNNIKLLNLDKVFKQPESFELVNSKFKYIGTGLYYFQLIEWFKLYKKENIKIISSSDLFNSPQSTYSDILSFLNIENHKLKEFPNFLPGTNNLPISKNVLKELEEFYKPHNQNLFKLLNRNIF